MDRNTRGVFEEREQGSKSQLLETQDQVDQDRSDQHRAEERGSIRVVVVARITSSQFEDPPGVHPCGVSKGEQGGQGEHARRDEADPVGWLDKVEQGGGDTSDQDTKV